MKRLAFASLMLVAGIALADEGMWTFNNFPSDKVGQKYGFKPTQEWLDHVRLSSLRIANGCSASAVSAEGLVMTNHHCVHRCIEQLSTAKKDFVAKGFYAQSPKDELRCPAFEMNQLASITDVTERITKATQGLADRQFSEAQKAEMARVEKECATSDDVRCEVVTLYRGGQYNLYKYRRFPDVRLVFAPEFSAAAFGGDPDNFNFPRYSFDAAFLRLYENDKPAKTEHHFKWSDRGAQADDLTFVSGHPGRTNRALTVAQLEFTRDVTLPTTLLRLAELRGYLTQFQARSAEHERISNSLLRSTENAFKALRGRHQALLDPKLMDAKRAAEKALRAKVDADPKLKASSGPAWDAISAALQRYRSIRVAHMMLEEGRGFSSELMTIGRDLVRASEELPKPNEQRLREYADARLPQLKQRLFSKAPIYDELEIATLTFALTQFRAEMGADDPIVKKVLGKQSPQELATALVKGSKLKDVAARQALFDGGQKAIEASKDPVIVLAKLIDPDARALRAKYEQEVEGPVNKSAEQIAKALFATQGTGSYPDATFTLRLSYGQVKGYTDTGREVKPFTTLAGLYDRHTGREPFALPTPWVTAQKSVGMEVPMNFVSTNDIIGGNSGSPVLNKNAEIVGLVFDGNIHSLGGDFAFDETVNRAVSVHSAAILEGLDKVYRAQRVVQELRPSAPVGTTGGK